MTQEMAATTNNAVALSQEEQQALAELQQGSGELEQTSGYVNIPYITVDNRMVEVSIPNADGTVVRKTKVRCEPNFVVTTKTDDGYLTELFAPEFEAVILKFKHCVQRKYKQDQQGNCINKMDFWRSLEFDSFKSEIFIRQNKEFLAPMHYGEVKKWAMDGDENELWGVVYFLIKGEDTIRKAEFKGASRGILFDYVTTKRDFKLAEVYTKFTVASAEDAAQPYNKLILTKTSERPESYVTLAKQQKELNMLLENSSVPSAKSEEGEVVSATVGDTTITGKTVGDEISFNGPAFN